MKLNAFHWRMSEIDCKQFPGMRRDLTEVKAMAAWEMTKLRVFGALPATLGPHSTWTHS